MRARSCFGCPGLTTTIHVATPTSTQFTVITLDAALTEPYFAIGGTHHIWIADGAHLWNSTDQGRKWDTVRPPWDTTDGDL